jgi:hypothetical protein
MAQVPEPMAQVVGSMAPVPGSMAQISFLGRGPAPRESVERRFVAPVPREKTDLRQEVWVSAPRGNKIRCKRLPFAGECFLLTVCGEEPVILPGDGHGICSELPH